MYDLQRTIENFAQQLRSKFRAEIELDTAQFKRRAIGLFPRNLPPQPGRPCAHPVTCAFRFRARKRPWPEVYRACLPASAGVRERINLCVAVRMRYLRLSKPRARKKLTLGSQHSVPDLSAVRGTPSSAT